MKSNLIFVATLITIIGCDSKKSECKNINNIIYKVDRAIVEVREISFFNSKPDSLRAFGTKFDNLAKEFRKLKIKTSSLKEPHSDLLKRVEVISEIFFTAAKDIETKNSVGIERAGHSLQGNRSMWRRAMIDFTKECPN